MARWDITQGFAQTMPWSPVHGFGDAGIIQFKPVDSQEATYARQAREKERQQAAKDAAVQKISANISKYPTQKIEFQKESDDLTKQAVDLKTQLLLTKPQETTKMAELMGKMDLINQQRANLEEKDRVYNQNFQSAQKAVMNPNSPYDPNEFNKVVSEHLADEKHDPNNPLSRPYRSAFEVDVNNPQIALADPRVLNPTKAVNFEVAKLKPSTFNTVQETGDYGQTTLSQRQVGAIAGFHKINPLTGAVVLNKNGEPEVELSREMLNRFSSQYPTLKQSVDYRLGQEGINVAELPTEEAKDQARIDYLSDRMNNREVSVTKKDIDKYRKVGTANYQQNRSNGWGDDFNVVITGQGLTKATNPYKTGGTSEQRGNFIHSGIAAVSRGDNKPITLELPIQQYTTPDGVEHNLKQENKPVVKINAIMDVVTTPKGNILIPKQGTKDETPAQILAKKIHNGSIEGVNYNNWKNSIGFKKVAEVNLFDKNNTKGEAPNEAEAVFNPITGKVEKLPNFNTLGYVEINPKNSTILKANQINPDDSRLARENQIFISDVDKELSKLGKPKNAGYKTVTTQTEYDALPKGTTYIDSQGNKGIKK